MAELEVAKHGKNVIHLMTKKEHTVSHRLREIAIEIAIIVFAVSMSIWLHGLSEHHHQQKEVRSFLVGLKSDLAADVQQLNNIKEGYRGFDANYAYLASLDPGKQPDWTKFKAAYDMLEANWFFLPTRSRYDGFLMSGRLANIEDEKLLTAILSLYQMHLPQIQTSEGGWSNRQHKLRDYRDDKLDTDDDLSHFRWVTSPKARRLLAQMQSSPQLYERYQNYIDQSRQIIKAIDAAYPDQAGKKAD
ncbi:hypothetical protein AB595_13580 [Massilia sp. WF1]|uniref:hypothetical protein n=1 Tax=unclassified Massilia TaxID=2609279 RepID=UPI00064A78FB|nr:MULTISPECIES: hypothetical protein [unclassified Massilia]ALK96568.1 hypothetical protein AM586_10040 [Massilia sp. WG5]KLU36263.1 hypothetical protein AB595_13580 [Massilia sp. WF1]